MWHSTQILALFWLVVEVTISWWIWKFLGYQSREEEEFEWFQKKHYYYNITRAHNIRLDIHTYF